MADFTYSYGTIATAIRNDLIYNQYGTNYAGSLLNYSILPQYSDTTVVPVGVYTFSMTYEYDNINGTIAVAQPGDTTPPTITGPSSVSFTLGDKTSNPQLLSSYYMATDNVGISSFYVSGTIFYGTAGTYNVTLVAQDTSNNTTTKDITVTINAPVDNVGPTITGPGSLLMEQQQYSLSYILSLFSASDPSGVASKVLLKSDFSTFNSTSWEQFYTQVGTFNLYVRATDNLGNNSFKTFILTIQEIPDNTPPTITSSATTLYFYRSVYDTFVPESVIRTSIENITTISDNLGEVYRVYTPALSQWQPESFTATRTYQVKAQDGAGNYSTNTINITLFYIDDVITQTDTTRPVLTATKTLFEYYKADYPNGVPSTQIESDFRSVLSATDNFGVTGIYFVTTIQNLTQFGNVSYFAYALDTSNNESFYVQMTANYIDDDSDTVGPLIIGPSSVTFVLSENKTINDLITLYSLFDESGSSEWYQLPSVVFNQLGTFGVLLRAIDAFGNISNKNVSVTVVNQIPSNDTTPPTITSKTGSWDFAVTTSQGLTVQNFIELYFTITDLSGIKSKTLSTTVNFNNPATYLTTLVVIDNANNVASQAITITVTYDGEPTEPTIPETNIDKIMLDGVDVTNQVKVGFTLIEKIDTELDVGTLILPVTTRSEPYKPFTKVYIYFKDIEEPDGYYVNDDVVTTMASGIVYYQHTINIIEPTKILERYRCQKMAFTQPIDEMAYTYTLKDVVDRINLNSPLKEIGQNGYIDSFEPTLYAKLDTIIAPQIVLDGMSMFEAFNRVFSYIGGIPVLKLKEDGTNELGITYYNALKDVVSTNGILTSTKTLNSDYFVGSASLSVENGVSEFASVKYPSKAFMGLRSNADIITSENVSIEVPFPIYQITKLILNVPVFNFNIGSPETYVQFDATKFIVEKSLYDTLPMVNDANIDNGTLHKNNTIYYNQSEKKIYNLFNTSNGMTWIENIWASFNMNLAPKNTINMMLLTYFGVRSYFFTNSAYSKVTFQIEYRTLLTSKLRVYKDLKDVYVGSLTLNQPERIVDLPAIANNAKGVINRVGNTDITLSKHVKELNDIFKVGQYTTDNYIITSVENQFFPDYIKSVGYFTKNYNGLSKFVGVDAELRYIPNPFESITTHVRKDQVMIISDTPYPINQANYAQIKLYDTLTNYLKRFSDKVLTSNIQSVLQVEFNSSTSTYTSPRKMLVIPSNVDVTSITIGLTALNVSATIEIKNVLSGALVFNQTYSGSQNIIIPNDVLVPGETYRWRLYQPSPYTTLASATLTVDYTKLVQFGRYSGWFQWGNGIPLAGNYSMFTPDISSFGNSIKVDFRMRNDWSAGDRVDPNVTGLLDGMKAVPYTDTNAKFKYFQFGIAELKEPANDSARIELSQRLPSVTTGDYENTIIQTNIFNYEKDTMEVFALTYQLHLLVDDAKNDTIILGKSVLEKMFGGRNTNDVSFVVYASTNDVYKKDENEKVKGNEIVANYTVNYDFANKQIVIEFENDLSSYKSFAIGNKNGDLIIGFNNYHPFTNVNDYKDTFYIRFSNSR